MLTASFNGPSDVQVWAALILSTVLAIGAGMWWRERVLKAGIVSGCSCGIATFIILSLAQGDMVELVAMVFSPIVAVGSSALAMLSAYLTGPRRPPGTGV